MATAAEENPEVNWNAAAEFFKGKPGAAEQTEGDEGESTPQEPQLVEVSIKGRKIKMAAEDAAAIEEFRREGRERDGRLGGENAAMRERLARLEGQIEAATRAGTRGSTPPAITPPDPKLVETDFAEWDRQNRAYHAAKMAELAAELEAKYIADRNQSATQTEEERRNVAWANKFYASFEHLGATPRVKQIVAEVYNDHKAEIDAMGSVAEQHERLAELADEELLSLRKISKTPSRKPPRLEGGSTPVPGKTVQEPREPFSAAKWTAKKRSALRGGGK